MFLTTPARPEVKVTVEDPKLAQFYEQYRPFFVKKDAELAPVNRFEHEVDAEFTSLFESPSAGVMPFDTSDCLRAHVKAICSNPKVAGRGYHRGRRKRNRPDIKKLVEREGDAVDTKVSRSELESHGINVKLLQFAEDHRPPYWGTFTKPSKLSLRQPFKRDSAVFNYDYDSEAEWEQDEEGEELVSDDDDETEEADAEEEEDDWLVPHGYLSDDEGLDGEADSRGVSPGPEKLVKKRDVSRRPAVQMVTPLVPFIIGPLFTDGCYAHSSDPYLDGLRIQVFSEELLQIDPDRHSADPLTGRDDEDGKKAKKAARPAGFPEEHLPHLVQIIHEKDIALPTVVDAVRAFLPNTSKRQIMQKVRDIAVKKRGKDQKLAWHVHEKFLPPDSASALSAQTTPISTTTVPASASSDQRVLEVQQTLAANLKSILRSPTRSPNRHRQSTAGSPAAGSSSPPKPDGNIRALFEVLSARMSPKPPQSPQRQKRANVSDEAAVAVSSEMVKKGEERDHDGDTRMREECPEAEDSR